MTRFVVQRQRGNSWELVRVIGDDPRGLTAEQAQDRCALLQGPCRVVPANVFVRDRQRTGHGLLGPNDYADHEPKGVVV